MAVVDCESDPPRVLRRTRDVPEAEGWIARRRDRAKVLRGGYGVDAPEVLVNPTYGPAMRWRVFSDHGVELDQDFGTSERGRREAEDAADALAREAGVPHVVRRGAEVTYRAEVRP